jgi:hypothetical protein
MPFGFRRGKEREGAQDASKKEPIDNTIVVGSLTDFKRIISDKKARAIRARYVNTPVDPQDPGKGVQLATAFETLPDAFGPAIRFIKPHIIVPSVGEAEQMSQFLTADEGISDIYESTGIWGTITENNHTVDKDVKPARRQKALSLGHAAFPLTGDGSPQVPHG